MKDRPARMIHGNYRVPRKYVALNADNLMRWQNQNGARVPVYLLTPKNLDHPRWELSPRKEPAQVEAISKEEARVRATELFVMPTAMKAGIARRRSPWASPDLASVRLLDDKLDGIDYFSMHSRGSDPRR